MNEPFDFRRASSEFVLPKAVLRVLDQLYEGDQQTPRMRPQRHESFEEDTEKRRARPNKFQFRSNSLIHYLPSNLLLNNLRVRFEKQVQQGVAKVMCMAVRIA